MSSVAETLPKFQPRKKKGKKRKAARRSDVSALVDTGSSALLPTKRNGDKDKALQASFSTEQDRKRRRVALDDASKSAGHATMLTSDADAVHDSSLNAMGPKRSAQDSGNNSAFDYTPDLCKDFLETGYCGWGDACIYMHDRNPGTPGWKVEKEWQEKRKAEREQLMRGGSAGQDEEGALPWACFLCRGDFQRPVQTACGHIFCETCALRRFRSDTRCAVCQRDTQGVF